MARKGLKRWEVRSFRFLTFSCHRREQLLGRPEWRDLFAGSLARARDRCGFELVGWVVMPEHAHLLIVPGRDATVPAILRSIKQPIAQRAIATWRMANVPILEWLRVGEDRYRYWQAGGGFDRLVRTPDELAKTLSYIHRNPVTRGLVENDTDWAWSSARWYAGLGGLRCDPVSW